MARAQQLSTPELVADAHRDRLRREAPDMLRRYGPEWAVERAWGVGEIAFAAVASLVGVLALGWSGPAALVFALASTWTGTVADALKAAVAFGAVRRFRARHHGDEQFWEIADAIRAGRRTIAARRHRYEPLAGILVDVVLGGIATLVILRAAGLQPRDCRAIVEAEPGLGLVLFGTIVAQLVAALATALRHRGPGDRAPMAFAAGSRGLGLFVVMFPIALFADDARAATIVLAGALFVLAVLVAADFLLLHRSVARLRAFLSGGGAPR